jgi:hypothetical protein
MPEVDVGNTGGARRRGRPYGVPNLRPHTPQGFDAAVRIVRLARRYGFGLGGDIQIDDVGRITLVLKSPAAAGIKD